MIRRSPSPARQADNYAPVNVGQLKNVATPFYDRLAAIGYQWTNRAFTTTPSPIYPWTGTTNPLFKNLLP